jgi:hypothetical protein
MIVDLAFGAAPLFGNLIAIARQRAPLSAFVVRAELLVVY